jgi:hypothetical protein
VQPSPAELGPLVQSLIKAMDSLPAEDLLFSHAVQSDDLNRQIYELKLFLEKRQVYLVDNLIKAYRNYFRRNISSLKCAEDPLIVKEEIPRSVRQANEALFSDNPLTFDDIRQAEISKLSALPQSPKATGTSGLMERYRVRFGPDRNEVSNGNGSNGADVKDEDGVLSKHQRESAEWGAQCRQFLIDLESWRPRKASRHFSTSIKSNSCIRG